MVAIDFLSIYNNSSGNNNLFNPTICKYTHTQFVPRNGKNGNIIIMYIYSSCLICVCMCVPLRRSLGHALFVKVIRWAHGLSIIRILLKYIHNRAYSCLLELGCPQCEAMARRHNMTSYREGEHDVKVFRRIKCTLFHMMIHIHCRKFGICLKCKDADMWLCSMASLPTRKFLRKSGITMPYDRSKNRNETINYICLRMWQSKLRYVCLFSCKRLLVDSRQLVRRQIHDHNKNNKTLSISITKMTKKKKTVTRE